MCSIARCISKRHSKRSRCASALSHHASLASRARASYEKSICQQQQTRQNLALPAASLGQPAAAKISAAACACSNRGRQLYQRKSGAPSWQSIWTTICNSVKNKQGSCKKGRQNASVARDKWRSESAKYHRQQRSVLSRSATSK